MNRTASLLACLILLLTGYVALDAADVLPGVLTSDLSSAHDERAGPDPGPQADGDAREVAAAILPPLPQLDPAAPVPAPAPLARALSGPLADPALGPSVGLDVRDGADGTPLLSVRADVPRTPASIAKLLTAAAVADATDVSGRYVTRVIRDGPGEIVLVAGGDTLLAQGRGRPDAVVGHAGLAGLASATAAALRADGLTSVRLRLDDSFAPGPRLAPGWSEADAAGGFTGPVVMLALASDRAVPGRAAPADPALAAARAFREALVAAGVTVEPQVTRAGPTGDAGGGPAGQPGPAEPPEELASVASAPIADVLALGLDESDNALTESVARWACTQHGVAPTFAACGAWVRDRIVALGVPSTGLRLLDTSGLTRGSSVPVAAVAQVLALASTGRVPALAGVVADLPVAGLTGTLYDRYLEGPQRAGAGLVRAKTGTLTGVGGLAGTLVDTSGRLLVYAVIADRVPAAGTLAARAALDRLVTRLAACGCVGEAAHAGPTRVPGAPTGRAPERKAST